MGIKKYSDIDFSIGKGSQDGNPIEIIDIRIPVCCILTSSMSLLSLERIYRIWKEIDILD